MRIRWYWHFSLASIQKFSNIYVRVWEKIKQGIVIDMSFTWWIIPFRQTHEHSSYLWGMSSKEISIYICIVLQTRHQLAYRTILKFIVKWIDKQLRTQHHIITNIYSKGYSIPISYHRSIYIYRNSQTVSNRKTKNET